MNLILKNAVPVICIALAAPLVLSSCSRTVSFSETTAPASSAVQEQAPSAESEDLAESAASSNESWKADFEKSLWENYNVTPEYYEDLGERRLSGLRQNGWKNRALCLRRFFYGRLSRLN